MPLHIDLASFDRLRMRSFLCGPCKGPFWIFLILSLSKDAVCTCSFFILTVSPPLWSIFRSSPRRR